MEKEEEKIDNIYSKLAAATIELNSLIRGLAKEGKDVDALKNVRDYVEMGLNNIVDIMEEGPD